MQTADVILANEPAVRVPIQVIDATFGTVPSSCTGAETGPTCASVTANGTFFSSDGSTTVGVAVPTSAQVQNPVAALPVDNNGLIVVLPGVPGDGAPAVEGAVVLGIGTRSNNIPGPATAIALDGSGDFTTTLAGGSPLHGSFVDTGSNGLFFSPPSNVPACTDHPDWFCPPATLSFSATNTPTPGFPGSAATASFQIANFDALVVQPNNANSVFAQIGGGALPQAGFDWGLPFFLGRTVYLGLQGRRSSLGGGPLLAY